MSRPITASVIISSYNYDRFLGIAIDSALNQTYPHTEVVVVDDGSRDKSAEVMASYGSRIKSLVKKNGGQASAFNAGLKMSVGEVVVFLDSDDMLLPDTVEKAVALFENPEVVKVHWNLWIGDQEGRTGTGVARSNLSEGDLREVVLRAGPDGYTWPPTSGNAWRRSFLEKAFPIPEQEFVTCPDLYLAAVAPLYGHVARIDQPQGFWRYHPSNASFCDAFGDNLRGGLRRAECCVQTIARHAQALGLPFDADEVRRNSRWHQMEAATAQIQALVPEGETLILVEEDHWKTGGSISGRRCLPFLEKDGQFWGAPPDDETAISELERLRSLEAHFIVFVWPYLWWLEYYAGFQKHLRSNYTCLADSDRLVAFDLRRDSSNALAPN